MLTESTLSVHTGPRGSGLVRYGDGLQIKAHYASEMDGVNNRPSSSVKLIDRGFESHLPHHHSTTDSILPHPILETSVFLLIFVQKATYEFSFHMPLN